MAPTEALPKARPQLWKGKGMTPDKSGSSDDAYTLHDLRVEVVVRKTPEGKDAPMVCKHKVGEYFELKGENLYLPDGQPFSIYALAALLPLLPAKQRMTHKNDWMTSDTDVACPDPHCGALFRITRTDPRIEHHSEATAVPYKKE